MPVLSTCPKKMSGAKNDGVHHVNQGEPRAAARIQLLTHSQKISRIVAQNWH